MEYARHEKGDLEAHLRPAPQYEWTRRRAGQLACGELAREPVLGLARVSAVIPTGPPFVRIGWTDDHGPSTAAGRYRADQSFQVRIPGHADRLRIRHGVDRANWLNQPITADVARRIAVHLHRGPASALYGFAIDGRITERFFDELDQLHADQPGHRPWVQALGRYAVSRDDLGPLPQWARESPGESVWLASQASGRRRRSQGRPPVVLARKQIRADLALQLIDAAYAIGVVAGKAAGMAEAIERPAWARYVAGAGE